MPMTKRRRAADPLKPTVVGPCKDTQGEDVAATVGRDDRKAMDALVDRFLEWPLPAGVCSDLCVTDRDYEHPRSGTNLLTAEETRTMLEYVLGMERQPK